MVGKCESQQATEQKTNALPLRLHVDTLHVQYGRSKPISDLHELHRRQKDCVMVPHASCGPWCFQPLGPIAAQRPGRDRTPNWQ